MGVNYRKLFSTLFLLGAFVGNANSTTINGAGASFPYLFM